MFRECPRYEKCSVNRCPLDSHREIRNTVTGDREKACRALRASRESIVARHPGVLAWGGLTAKEQARDRGVELVAKQPTTRDPSESP